MTELQKENMEAFKQLGFSVKNLTYDQIVSELIHRYVETSSACEMDDFEKFKKDLQRVTRTETN